MSKVSEYFLKTFIPLKIIKFPNLFYIYHLDNCPFSNNIDFETFVTREVNDPVTKTNKIFLIVTGEVSDFVTQF